MLKKHTECGLSVYSTQSLYIGYHIRRAAHFKVIKVKLINCHLYCLLCDLLLTA